MVMGDDSCLRGRGFEIQQHIMDGHFFGLICCKNCIVCMKRPKMNNKVAEVCTFKKIGFLNMQFWNFTLFA